MLSRANYNDASSRSSNPAQLTAIYSQKVSFLRCPQARSIDPPPGCSTLCCLKHHISAVHHQAPGFTRLLSIAPYMLHRSRTSQFSLWFPVILGTVLLYSASAVAQTPGLQIENAPAALETNIRSLVQLPAQNCETDVRNLARSCQKSEDRLHGRAER